MTASVDLALVDASSPALDTEGHTSFILAPPASVCHEISGQEQGLCASGTFQTKQRDFDGPLLPSAMSPGRQLASGWFNNTFPRAFWAGQADERTDGFHPTR